METVISNINIHLINNKNVCTNVVNQDKIILECGEKLSATCERASKVAPFGKVAVIYNVQSFDKFGVELTKSLKGKQIFPINVVVENNFSASNLCGLFNLAEDVRAVISFGQGTENYALYYASTKNIPIICLASMDNYLNFFKNTIVFITDNGREEIFCDCKRFIIFDKDCSRIDSSNTYAYVLSKIVALYDYRIRAIAQKENFNKQAYKFMKDNVFKTLKAFTFGGEKRNNQIFCSCLEIAVLNFLLNGEVLDKSSAKLCTEFMGEGDSVKLEFFCSLYILAYYQNISYKRNFIDKGLLHRRLLSVLFKLPLGYLTNLSMCKIKILNNLEQAAQKEINNISKECANNLHFLPQVLKQYFMLGGVNEYPVEKIKQAISFVDNLTENVSGLTFL